jgi:hypothetical protein
MLGLFFWTPLSWGIHFICLAAYVARTFPVGTSRSLGGVCRSLSISTGYGSYLGVVRKVFPWIVLMFLSAAIVPVLRFRNFNDVVDAYLEMTSNFGARLLLAFSPKVNYAILAGAVVSLMVPD